MSGVANGYTLVLANEGHGGGAPVTDYIVTDGGVLFASGDHGATWRCYGVVDPELFLIDLGFVEEKNKNNLLFGENIKFSEWWHYQIIGFRHSAAKKALSISTAYR